MRKCFIILFLLLLFSTGCTAQEEPTAPAELPTEPTAYTETEKLYFHGHSAPRQQLESFYDDNGSLTQTRKTEYYENGSTAGIAVTQYDEQGAVTNYQEKRYGENGAAAASLVKRYVGGTLTEQVEVSYWTDTLPHSVTKSVYLQNGTLSERTHTSYFADGTLAAKETETLDEKTGFRTIHQEAYHETGVSALLCDGLFHAETYEMLAGQREESAADGTLTMLELAAWDGENRIRHSSQTHYTENGNTRSSQQVTQYYDASGRVTAREYAAYEKGQALLSHCIENYTYDGAGNLINMDAQYYFEGKLPGERFEHSYDYDAENRLSRQETAHFLASGERQNLAVTEYGYDAAGNLVTETQTAFNASDVRQFQTTKEYDAFGTLTAFITISKNGNRYTYSYTYDEEGRQQSELLTTEYRYGTRIDYQKTSYEYHKNGAVKSISVQIWTSHDEAKYPDAAPGDLGKTTVTEYDEAGNKI